MIGKYAVFLIGTLLFCRELQAECHCPASMSVEEFNELKEKDVVIGNKTYELLGAGKHLQLDLDTHYIEIFNVKPSPVNMDNCLCKYVVNKISAKVPKKYYFDMEERPVLISSSDFAMEVFKFKSYMNQLNLPPQQRNLPEGQKFYHRRDGLMHYLERLDFRSVQGIPVYLIQEILAGAKGYGQTASYESQMQLLDILESEIQHLKGWLNSHKK